MAKESTSAPLFDTYVMVDWSGSRITIKNGTPTIKNGTPKRDAIWWAIQRRPSKDAWKWPGLRAKKNYRSPSTFDRIESCVVFERTRQEAIEHIATFLAGEARAHKRVLIGFDFAFGYPAGFAETIEAVTRRKPSADNLRHWLYDKVLPDEKLLDGEWPVVEDNHFRVASCLNEAVKNYSNRVGRSSKPEGLREEIREGPFWDGNNELRTVKKDDPHDPYGQERGRVWPFGFRRRRRTDELAKSRPVWQLTGSGSVGSQVLLGLPWLQHLYKRLLRDGLNHENCGIWPFDHRDFFAKKPERPRIVMAEIYPSLITKGIGDMIPDRSQVMENARAFELLDTRGLLKDLFDLDSFLDKEVDRVAVTEEEGWILGTGCDRILQSVAKPDSALFRKETPNGTAERA